VPNEHGHVSISPGGTGIWIRSTDRFGKGQTGYISTWDDSTGTVKGSIIIRPAISVGSGGATGTVVFQVTTGHNRTAYWEFEGSLLVPSEGTGGIPFIQDKVLSVNFAPKGNDGSLNIGAALFETDSGVSHASNNTLGTDEGTARKVAFLLDNGSLTFDFIRNYDVFKPSDFTFSLNTFSFSGNSSSQTVLIGNANTPITSDAAFSAKLVAGPALTAQITVESSNGGVGFPIWFSSLTNKSTITGSVPSGVSITAGAGGSVTIRLRATGNAPGGSQISDTETVTYNFYNHLLYGVTSAASLTSDTLTGPWLNKSLSNSLDQTFTFNVPQSEYIFFAHPKRLGECAFQINDIGQGGFSPQGIGGVPGLSTHAYSNMNNYTENYTIYRSTNSGLGDNTKVDTGSDTNQL